MKNDDLNFILNTLQTVKAELSECTDWYSVLGFLELNKISGVFYDNLKKLGIKVPQQISRKLNNIKNIQVKRNNLMAQWIERISVELNNKSMPHAFLKGSVLSNYGNLKLYDEGERISNDIDILVSQNNLSEIHKVLTELEFEQGYFDFNKNEFVKLSRSEIISRRMNRGETAPYIKLINDSIIDFIEIDINFSLSYLPESKNVDEFLQDVKLYDAVYSLTEIKFFVYLILHQYKESILYSMVQRNKDLELYKLLDIYLFLKNKLIDYNELYDFCKKFNIEKECYYVLYQTTEVFDTLKEDNGLMDFMNMIKPYCLDYLYAIIDPENKNQAYEWQISLVKRLCMYDKNKCIVKILK